jgi:hypothetical protein
VQAVPRLCKFNPGICFTTEEKARTNLCQGKKNLRQVKKKTSDKAQYTYYQKHPHITKPSLSHTHTHTHTHTLQNPHKHTHYKTHSYTRAYTHTLQNNIKPPQYKLKQNAYKLKQNARDIFSQNFRRHYLHDTLQKYGKWKHYLIIRSQCELSPFSRHRVSYAVGGAINGTCKTERVAGSREESLAEIAGAHSDACFRRIVPFVFLEIARWLLDMSVKIVFK